MQAIEPPGTHYCATQAMLFSFVFLFPSNVLSHTDVQQPAFFPLQQLAISDIRRDMGRNCSPQTRDTGIFLAEALSR